MEGEKQEEEEEEEEYQDLPIMQWEDLSQRIAELEKQEQERRERAKRGAGLRTEESHGGVWRDLWDQDEEDFRRCHVAVVSSRFHNHRNLQLCFVNNEDSDEEDGNSNKVAMGTGGNGCHSAGLKQEVVTALRTLRDKVLAEQREEHPTGNSSVAKRKHLERWELQEFTAQQLCSLRASLQQDAHALSSELVAHLLVRDQLRTKQDAMLLDVQDLT